MEGTLRMVLISGDLRRLLWRTGSERVFSSSVLISLFCPPSVQTSGNLHIWGYLDMLQARRNGDYYLQCTVRDLPERWPVLKNSDRKDAAGLLSPTPSGAWQRMHTCSAEGSLVPHDWWVPHWSNYVQGPQLSGGVGTCLTRSTSKLMIYVHHLVWRQPKGPINSSTAVGCRSVIKHSLLESLRRVVRHMTNYRMVSLGLVVQETRKNLLDVNALLCLKKKKYRWEFSRLYSHLYFTEHLPTWSCFLSN